jgi:hypothetical protein
MDRDTKLRSLTKAGQREDRSQASEEFDSNVSLNKIAIRPGNNMTKSLTLLKSMLLKEAISILLNINNFKLYSYECLIFTLKGWYFAFL